MPSRLAHYISCCRAQDALIMGACWEHNFLLNASHFNLLIDLGGKKKKELPLSKEFCKEE